MTRLFALTIALGSIGTLVAAPTIKDKDAAKKLEGKWTFTAFEQAGRASFAADALKELKWTVVGDKYTFDTGNASEEGTIKIDAAKKPATIDLSITSGVDEGKSQPGIYKIDGDEITFCLARPGGTERPTEFTSTEKNDFILVKFKKIKRDD